MYIKKYDYCTLYVLAMSVKPKSVVFDDFFMRYFRTAGALWSSPEHEPFARHDCEIVVPMNKMFFLQASMAASLDDRSNLLCFGQDDCSLLACGRGRPTLRRDKS